MPFAPTGRIELFVSVIRSNILAAPLAAFCVLVALWAPLAHGDEVHAADTLFDGAQELFMQEGPRPALPVFEQALDAYRLQGDRAGEAITLGWIGNCLSDLGDPQKGLGYLKRALDIKRELGERLEEGKTLSHMGLVYWDLANYPEATAHLQTAISIGRTIGDKRLEGSARNNLSLIFDELGDFQKSLAGYKQALALYADADFPRGESDVLSNIGGVHNLLGRYRQAIPYYRQALSIDERLGMKPALSWDYGNLALCYLGLGEFDKALEYFHQAQELASQTGLSKQTVYWLKGRAATQLNLGRYDLALDLYQQSLDGYERIGAKAELIETRGELGALLLRLGDLVQAEEQLQQALQVAEEVQHHRGITQSLIALGDLQGYRRRFAESLPYYQRAIERAETVGDQARMAEGLARIGLAYVELDRINEGVQNAQQALNTARMADLRLHVSQAEYVLGRLEEARDRPVDAQAHYLAAESTAAGSGDPDLLWRIHYGAARTLEAGGDKLKAIKELRQSVSVIEGVRGQLREQRFRAGYLEDKYQVYVELVRLLLELDLVEEAFSTAEKLRAHSFTTLLESARPINSGTPSQRQNVATLRDRILKLQSALRTELEQPGEQRRQAAIQIFSSELIEAESTYQALLDDIQSSGSGLGVGAGPVAATTAGEVKSVMQPGHALVEYVVDREQVFTFVVTATGIHATHVAVRQIDLHGKVELLRALLQEVNGDAWRKPARDLASLLIDPLTERGWLAGVDTLNLVPHGVLNYLPFGVLLQGPTQDGRFLIADYITNYLPAAAVLLRSEGVVNTTASVLALAPGRTRLKYAAEEAQSIGDLFPNANRVLTGNQASEAEFKRLATDYRVLHLATHGNFNSLNPLLSGLELEAGDGEDGNLQVHEILNLRLQAELVTLSACDTALASGYFSDVPAGDEFVGLTRAFLSAGSGSVLASLWEVNDRSTLEFMVDFYGRLGTEPKDRSVAMVQRNMAASDGRYRHPYYWAPYVLIGATGEFASKRDEPARLSITP